jgi:superfamily II DNA or RNA helicase
MSINLRQWQAECEAAWAASAEQCFLIAALPGAGKTAGSSWSGIRTAK